MRIWSAGTSTAGCRIYGNCSCAPRAISIRPPAEVFTFAPRPHRPAAASTACADTSRRAPPCGTFFSDALSPIQRCASLLNASLIKRETRMKIETKAIHAGRQIDPATGAVTPPIHLSTTFAREPDGSYPTGFEYIRDSNPNRDGLEACVAELENGAAAAAFASGSMATMVIFQTLLPGDHVIAPDDLYFGVRQMLNEHFVPWGLNVAFVDMADPRAVEQAVRPATKLILAETPSNPLIKVTNIKKIAAIARQAGANFVCDNTMATPVLQQPLELGADFVVHSATKYLGGHSDTMCGLVVAREANELFLRIKKMQKVGGAVPSPFT